MKNGVRATWGDDESAVDDVVNQTAERLMELALPDAGGRFDPVKAQPGISGRRRDPRGHSERLHEPYEFTASRIVLRCTPPVLRSRRYRTPLGHS